MNKNKMMPVTALVIASLIAGCGTTNKSINGSAGQTNANSAVRIGYFSANSFQPNVYATLERQDTSWRIVALSKSRPEREHDKQEIVVMDRSGTRIQPAYSDTYTQFNRQGELTWFDCSEVLSALAGGSGKKLPYSGCSSSEFNQIDVASTVGKNAIAAVLTLGLAAGSKRKVNTDAMETALTQTNAFQLMKLYSDLDTTVGRMNATLAEDLNAKRQVINKAVTISDVKKLVPVGLKVRPEIKTHASGATITLPSLTAPSGGQISQQQLQAETQRLNANFAEQRTQQKVTTSCGGKGNGFDFTCNPASFTIGIGDPVPPITATVSGNQDYLAKVERENRAAEIIENNRARAAASSASNRGAVDAEGRKIIRGTVAGGYHDRVHIISSGLGVDASTQHTTITNSVIEADVCVLVGAAGSVITNNLMKCGTCVAEASELVFNNQLIGNTCTN